MKKRTALLLCVMILSCLMLAACGGDKKQDLSDSKYVGTWTVSALSLQGETEDLEEDWTLVLNGDGTGQLTGGDETSDFTWELTSDGFKTKGDVKLTFKDDGDNITTKIIGVDLVFERQ